MTNSNLYALQQLTEVLTTGTDEIRMRSELLGVLFNAVPIGIIIVSASPDYKILAANNQVLEYLGYSDENELLHKTPMDITKPGDAGSDLQDLHNIHIAAQNGKAFNKTYLRADGTPFKARIKLYHLFDNLGVVTRTIVMVEKECPMK